MSTLTPTCDSHYSCGTIIGELTPELVLVDAHDTYTLVWCTDRASEDLVTFSGAPQSDPLTPEIEARIDAVDDSAQGDYLGEDVAAVHASFDWVVLAEEAMRPLTRLGGNLLFAYTLVTNLVTRGGYDPEVDGLVEYWLYNRLGQLVCAYEAGGRVPNTGGPTV
jgi:hypothetical protein